MTPTRKIAITLATVLFASGLLLGQASRSTEVQFKAAQNKEQVEGDLKGAIEEYRKLAQSKDRNIAAMALVRMADVYRRMGDTESRRIYEQVVKDFADQKDAVTLARERLGGSGTSAGMSSKRVWSGSKVDSEGTVSRDGRFLSFPDWDTGDLAIHEFASGLDRRLTENKLVNGRYSTYAEESAISKDGKLIAYSWFDGKNSRYELRLANLTGDANPRRLYDNPDTSWLMPHDWTPDGKSIAVELLRKDRTEQLGLVSVTDGTFHPLKTLDWDGVRGVFFSPDGRWLGFDLRKSSENPERDVFVLSVDGSRELHAVEHAGQDEMVGWSHDGKWLLFSSDRTGSTDLWAVPFDGGSFGAAQLLKAGFERSTPLGVTNSGVLYYGQTKGGDVVSRIQTATVDFASGRVTAPVEIIRHYGDSDTNPVWSPDGKRLAYLSQRGPLSARSNVLVVRSSESEQLREIPLKLVRRITLDGWAPAGHSLLLFGWDAKGQYGMNFVDSETGEVRVYSLDQLGQVTYNVSWAPDARSFLMEIRGPKPGLYRADAATGDVSQVMPTPPTQTNAGLYAAWSSDGKSFYYRTSKSRNGATAGEDFAIIERNISSGAERELARRPFFLGPPKPTQDGRYVLTDTVDPDTNSRLVVLIPVAGGTFRELLRIPAQVKPGDLNDPYLGQWPLPVGALALSAGPDSVPLLVVKRLGDSVENKMAIGKEPSELWLVPVNGGEPRKIGTIPAEITSIAISRDARHVAYTMGEPGAKRATEIWSLENFLPATAAKK